MAAVGEAGRGIATCRGVQEVVFTVADLDREAETLRACFGAAPVHEGGEVRDDRGSSMRRRYNADVRAVVRRSRVLRTPFLDLHLLEATAPDQRTQWPGMLDVGGWHLAGYVDDIDAALAHLDGVDVYVLDPGKKPTTNGPEIGDGSFAAHGMARSGFHFELLTYPNGRAYMDDRPDRLWNPERPDRGATDRVAPPPAVPGFRGFEHLSLAVADIDEATWFFEHVLGCERFYDMGPVSDPAGSGFGAYANVDVRVEVSTVRLFRSPYLNFEVIEARYPGQRRTWPARLDVGGWALGLAVGDLEAASASVRSLGVRVLDDGRDESAGRTSVRRRAPCLTPFGLAFDLIEGPPVAGAGECGWHPARPAS